MFSGNSLEKAIVRTNQNPVSLQYYCRWSTSLSISMKCEGLLLIPSQQIQLWDLLLRPTRPTPALKTSPPEILQSCTIPDLQVMGSNSSLQMNLGNIPELVKSFRISTFPFSFLFQWSTLGRTLVYRQGWYNGFLGGTAGLHTYFFIP